MNTVKYSALFTLLLASSAFSMHSVYKPISQITAGNSTQEAQSEQKPEWLKMLGPVIQATCHNPENESEVRSCTIIQNALSHIVQRYPAFGQPYNDFKTNLNDQLIDASFDLVKNRPLNDDNKVKEIRTAQEIFSCLAEQAKEKCDSKYYVEAKVCRHSYARDLGFKV